jgi:hypothetical protein
MTQVLRVKLTGDKISFDVTLPGNIDHLVSLISTCVLISWHFCSVDEENLNLMTIAQCLNFMYKHALNCLAKEYFCGFI